MGAVTNDRQESGRGREVGIGAINLAERFAYSEHFKALFREGMGLVEQSATYLDGPGRLAAKRMSRKAALLYGTESMRLTTRLMQLASWLLLQRAASEGEMTREQLLAEKQKVKLDNLPPTARSGPDWAELPDAFDDLVARAMALQSRILMLDAEVYGAARAVADPSDNPVNQQIQLLQTALGTLRRG